MDVKNKNIHWIIMADIIKSSDYQGLILHEEFKDIVKVVNLKFKKKLISPLTITLGDEFQGITKRLKDSIDIIIYMEETILKKKSFFALRYIVNCGEIETPINSEIAYGMLGEGLTNARKMLESLKNNDLRFDFEIGKIIKNQSLKDAFLIFQNIQSKWHSKDDKKMASLFIQYHDYKVIASKTGITRSQIWKKEKSLNISSYFAIKNIISYLSK